MPDEWTKRYELIVQPRATTDVKLAVNGKPLAARQSAKDARWSTHAFDLRAYRGETISISARLKADPAAARKPGPTARTEAWVLADRLVAVAAAAVPLNNHLPHPISQHCRRTTQCVLTKRNVPVQPSK